MGKVMLKDAGVYRDPRLGRIAVFDERSRAYPIRRQLHRLQGFRSQRWSCDVRLDQGSEGACVGFGLAAELACMPAAVPNITNQFARECYWEFQKHDGFPGGAYAGADPYYEGTTVIAGLQVMRMKGWFDNFYWAFSLEELILGLGNFGPVILGIPVYEGMMEPEEDGRIRPTGELLGGHCILGDEVDLNKERVWMLNSWGNDWGIDGRCYLTFDDLKTVLKEEGEAAFVHGRHMTPRGM